MRDRGKSVLHLGNARLVASGHLDATLENAEVPVPARVRDAIRLHLKQRSSACEDLLKLASVTRRQIELFLLNTALVKSQNQTLELLDGGGDQLAPPRSSEPACYDFVHDLVRGASVPRFDQARTGEPPPQGGSRLESLLRGMPIGWSSLITTPRRRKKALPTRLFSIHRELLKKRSR